jgi:hypothetical protein
MANFAAPIHARIARPSGADRPARQQGTLASAPCGGPSGPRLRTVSAAARGGCSGYPKISGRVIRGFKISGFENRYSKLQWVLQYPKIWVPGISGSGISELPELLCRLHKNTYTLLN